MPQDYRISGAQHFGVIKSVASDTYLREPGFEDNSEILIASTRGQFPIAPSAAMREIVEIDDGPYEGRWILTGMQNSVSHYFMTCRPTD